MSAFYMLDGACHELPDGEAVPDGAVPIERLPIIGERVDPVTGAITLDHALKADMEADPRAVAAAHLRKSIEAALVLSGIPLTHGLLAQEAEATGVELGNLAEQVAAKAAPADAVEIARRVAKSGKWRR